MMKKSIDGNRPPVNITMNADQRPVRDRGRAVDMAGTVLSYPAVDAPGLTVRWPFDKQPPVGPAMWLAGSSAHLPNSLPLAS